MIVAQCCGALMLKIIIPIMNSSVTLLKGPTHFLDENVWIDKISDEEFGVISKAPAEYSSIISTGHRCIFISEANLADGEATATFVASVCRYVLNHFRDEGPLSLPFAIMLKAKPNGKGMVVASAFDLSDDMRHAKKAGRYKIKPGVTRDEVSGFYLVVKRACVNHKKLKLTLNRFSSALARPRLSDKIIDITISLESMIQDDKAELSFRFALYNSYAANRRPDKRAEIYELFKKLYNTRSLIVHGAQDEEKERRLLGEIEQDWSKLEDASRRSINELIFFAQDGNPRDWTKHLLEKIVNAQPQELGAEA